ncbi:unnamed protein product [Discosporangium mesarthrocarpum]
MDLTIQPGKIHLLHEVIQGVATGSVRVIGSLRSYDAAADEAMIEYKGASLPVNTSLIPGFQFRQDSLFEFIGEVEDGGGGGATGKKLRARVYRNVDGLDTNLFEKALRVRRAFLADPDYVARAPS